jgi:hypothetical protein
VLRCVVFTSGFRCLTFERPVKSGEARLAVAHPANVVWMHITTLVRHVQHECVCHLQVVSAGVKAGSLHTALELVHGGKATSEVARTLLCSSRGRSMPLPLAALEYVASRVNTFLEAHGTGNVSVENDIAVNSAGEPTAPSAELLAAAACSVPAANELGMLRPVARPWRCVPTLPLAGSGVTILHSSDIHTSLRMRVHEPSMPGMLAAAYDFALLQLVLVCLSVLIGTAKCRGAAMSDIADCAAHGVAAAIWPWTWLPMLMYGWAFVPESTRELDVGPDGWAMRSKWLGFRHVCARGEASKLAGAKVWPYRPARARAPGQMMVANNSVFVHHSSMNRCMW